MPPPKASGVHALPSIMSSSSYAIADTTRESTMSSIPAAQLLWDSAKPVVKIFLTASGGAILFKSGAMDTHGLKMLSKVNIYLLSPPLLFTKVATGISSDDMERLGIIVLTAMCYISLGLSCGWAIKKFTNPIPNFSYAIIACSAWGNWGDIPLAVVLSLCVLPPFQTGDDTKAVAYVSIFLACFYATLWGVGYKLFAMDFREDTKKFDPEDISVDAQSLHESTLEGGMVVDNDAKDQSGVVVHPKSDSLSSRTVTARPPGVLLRIWRNVASVLNPPNIALILGFIFAFVPALKRLVYRTDGTSPPLGIFFDTLSFLAQANVPMGLISLGGGLAQASFSHIRISTVAIMVAAKLLLMPVFGYGMVELWRHFNWIRPHVLRSIEIGTTLLVMYLVSCFTMTGFIAYYLHILQ
ncbi:membrane transport protein-domain-containing protein [Blyttiomyces helicus]|uniref:Membrane transport protein-domain-containing protein n=1 Tax=Blyttiomyces helicus TaxID=388810 RepID=A0A4P9VZY1_9FUNG|nr:membrane transport protein-domain-containing protein [Blyttiomyces helicus]|eukprot:RKO84363.1 membrane transport protein-domain-containing protein [Blyttiomyces helicus]